MLGWLALISSSDAIIWIRRDTGIATWVLQDDRAFHYDSYAELLGERRVQPERRAARQGETSVGVGLAPSSHMSDVTACRAHVRKHLMERLTQIPVAHGGV